MWNRCYGREICQLTQSPLNAVTLTIELHFWKKEQIHSYPKEMGTHPVSEVREHKR